MRRVLLRAGASILESMNQVSAGSWYDLVAAGDAFETN